MTPGNADAAASADDTGAADTPEDETASIDATRITLGDATLSVPADADPEEAAAIATAIGAHLADSARAVARANTESGSGPEPADRWRLATRLRGRTLPREVARGEEWAAAARSQW